MLVSLSKLMKTVIIYLRKLNMILRVKMSPLLIHLFEIEIQNYSSHNFVNMENFFLNKR